MEIFVLIIYAILVASFRPRGADPVVKTYEQKVNYFRTNVASFKAGLLWFFLFNIFAIIGLPLIAIFSILALYSQIDLMNRSVVGFDLAVSFLIFLLWIFHVFASESFVKFKRLRKFMRDKNDFTIDDYEAKVAIEILESSPIPIEKALENPNLSIDKIQKLIDLMLFCDFVKIKNGEIYQIGLGSID